MILKPSKVNPGAFRPALYLALVLAVVSVSAKPQFQVSEISSRSPELMACDLRGDGRKDLVLMDGTNLAIFYQDPKQGFTREPQQTYALEPRPCLVWTAKMGRAAESLLVMTSDGVNELCFTNPTGPPIVRQITQQPTVIPNTMDRAYGLPVRLSVGTGGDWPLLLVPTPGGLQVWQHRDEWRRAQVIEPAMAASLWPSLGNPGYTTTLGFNFSVGDVNGDGRDDLMIKYNNFSQTNIYRLYLQTTNGRFTSEPVLVYADTVEPFQWLSWTDLNHDGRLDLIKSVWRNEPSYIPGVPAGKVLVSVYTPDGRGRIPAEPQQIFRKNDWTPACPLLDVDGDGFPDLVLGYNHLDSKEALSKEMITRQIDYSLRFYFNRPGTGLPDTADYQRDVIIRLDHAEGLFDWNLAKNFQRYVRLDGDFNGDGKADLLVRDRRDAISVYFFISREKGFSAEPDLQFACPEPTEAWQVTDLNHDGVSDLIVKLADQTGYRIFLSQK